MNFYENIEQLRRSACLYRSTVILTFFNKVSRLGNLRKIVYLALLSGGFYLLFDRISEKPITDSSIENGLLTTIFYLYVFLRWLSEGKFAIRREDVGLLQVSPSFFNPLIGSHFIVATTKLFFPVIFSIYIGSVQNSFTNGMAAFLFLFLFVNTVNGIGFYFKLYKLFLQSHFVYAINAVLLICVCLSLIAYIDGWAVSDLFAWPIAPITTPLVSLMQGKALTISHWCYLFILILFFLLMMAFFFEWLSKIDYRLSLETENTSVRFDDKQPFSAKRFTSLVHRMMMLKRTLMDKSCIFSLILPSVIFIFFSVYGFHVANSHQQEVNATLFIFAEWLALIGFPAIYLTPDFKRDLKHLWIYRYSSRGTHIFLRDSLLKYYISQVISLLISFVVITLYLLCVNNIFVFEFMNIYWWALFTFVMPVLFSLIGLFIVLKLPNVCFNSDGNLSLIPMLSLIWLIALTTLPIPILIISRYTAFSILFFLILTAIFWGACRHNILKREI